MRGPPESPWNWGYQIENNEVEDFENWKLNTYLDNTIYKGLDLIYENPDQKEF